MSRLKAFRPKHPDIDESMWDDIDEIITRYQNKPGCVIAVLRECQARVGYLPRELMDHIAFGLNLPGSDVYGVASFYSLFSMTPKGRHTIRLCLGTACYVKGVREIMNRISTLYKVEEGSTSEDRRFSLEAVRCLGACGLAPVMVVGNNTHGGLEADEIKKILDQYT